MPLTRQNHHIALQFLDRAKDELFDHNLLTPEFITMFSAARDEYLSLIPSLQESAEQRDRIIEALFVTGFGSTQEQITSLADHLLQVFAPPPAPRAVTPVIAEDDVKWWHVTKTGRSSFLGRVTTREDVIRGDPSLYQEEGFVCTPMVKAELAEATGPYRASTPKEEAALDAAVGVVKVTMRLPTKLHDHLIQAAKESGMILPAYIREKLSSASARSPNTAPAGMVLVPREPTAAMRSAAFDALEVDASKTQYATATDARDAVWEAMLAAAPAAQVAK